MVEIKQYDVHWINLDPTVGSEMNKTQPCVIVSPNELNKYLRTVVIIPVTSTVKDYPWRVKCFILNREGAIAVDQIKVINKSRIGSKACSLSKEEVKAVKKTLIKVYVD